MLEILNEKGWVSNITAENASKQYKSLIRNKDFIQQTESFDVNSQRVDDFYASKISNVKDFQDLWFVTKKVVILSHGNGRVESGFSINEDLLHENMKQESVVAQRLVYDGVVQEGGLLKVDICREMMKEVRKSRTRYQNALSEKRKQQNDHEKQIQEKRRLTAELKQLQTEKKAAKRTADEAMGTLDAKIFEIEEKIRKY